MTARVLHTYRRASAPIVATAQPSVLTARERGVLKLVARGMTNTEIADTLGISGTTVKTHIGRIFVKLDLRDRSAAIGYAYDHGIVTAARHSHPDLPKLRVVS